MPFRKRYNDILDKTFSKNGSYNRKCSSGDYLDQECLCNLNVARSNTIFCAPSLCRSLRFSKNYLWSPPLSPCLRRRISKSYWEDGNYARIMNVRERESDWNEETDSKQREWAVSGKRISWGSEYPRSPRHRPEKWEKNLRGEKKNNIKNQRKKKDNVLKKIKIKINVNCQRFD